MGGGSYWDEALSTWQARAAPPEVLWRRHSDAVNRDLLRRWWPAGTVRAVLKTDAWDEAVGDGLAPLLLERAGSVTVADVADDALQAAGARHPAVTAVRADVRDLPFPDGHFDLVVSNSTLDHFGHRREIGRSLAELARVLEPGGTLLVTLDNRANPVVAVRTHPRLSSALARARVVPYALGVTLGPRGLTAALTEHGFAVEELAAVMHAPPRPLARLAAGRSPRRHLAAAMGAERAGGWPTRWLTGHFVAARAVRLP